MTEAKRDTEPQPGRAMARGPIDERAWAAIAASANGSVHAAFARIALRYATRPAIIEEQRTWNFGEVAAAAAGVQALLEVHGVERGVGVGVLFAGPAQQIAAMLGILRAGQHYVVLDPEFPEQRLNDIVADGAMGVLLAAPEFAACAARLSGGRLPVLRWNGEPAADAPAPVASPPDALAYVAYTSGTTGRPKGVMHPHANILHEAAVHRAALGLGAEDRSSLLYSPGVVGSVRDIFGTLLAGGAVCPFPFKRRGFGALCGWLRAQRVTQLHAVPAVFRELAAAMAPDEILPEVRTVFVAGDRVLPDDVRRFRRHFAPTARFYTGIGASETSSIYTHWFVDERGAETGGRLPTGWPLPHKDVRIVDAEGRDLSRGGSGEIVVASPYLAIGYWRRPELTAAAFATTAEGGRCYRTGDLGCFDAAGRLIHLGRSDQQVKINGERIELAEVERALLAAPGVSAAAVRAFPAPVESGRLQLIAYVAAAAASYDEAVVRAELARRLSPSGRPGRIVRLDALPLTPTGKIDRAALPAPMPRASPRSAENASATQPATEAAVRALWRGVLPQAHPTARDESFEQLGGDSLQAVRLALLLREHCGVEWPAALTLREATVARLVAHVEAAQRGAGDPALDRFHLLAATWSMHELGRRVGADVPVFLAGEQHRRPALIWLGVHGLGLQIGVQLARARPVYLVPALSHSSATSAAAIDEALVRLAARLGPLLPPHVMVGGLCASGLQAMMLSRALARGGRDQPMLVVVDAFGTRRLWRMFERLRLFESRRLVEFRLHRLRQLGAWAFLCEEVRNLRRRSRGQSANTVALATVAAARAASPASAIAVGKPEPLLEVLPRDTPGEMLHGLSRGCGWLRWLSPGLGWSAAGANRRRTFALPVGHVQLWETAHIPRVAACIDHALCRHAEDAPGARPRIL